MQTISLSIAAGAFALALALAGPAAAASPTGTWLTEDGDAWVSVGDCATPPVIPGAKPVAAAVAAKKPADAKTAGKTAGPTPSGLFCGTIVSLKNPVDRKTGQPPVDENNPDVAKRSQTIVGVRILRDMKPNGSPDEWAGEVYNPNDGKVYRAKLALKSPDKLRVEGCMLFICSGETWTRNSPVVTGSTAK